LKFLLGGALAAFHRALRVAAFFGGRSALTLQGGAGCLQRHDGVAEHGLVLSGQESEKRGVVGALSLRFGDDGLFLRLPSVLNPQIQRLGVIGGQRVIERGRELAFDVVLALHHTHLLQHLGEASLQQVGAALLHALWSPLELGFLGAELVVPGAGFSRLQPVLGAILARQCHDQTVLILQLVQQRGQFLAQFA